MRLRLTIETGPSTGFNRSDEKPPSTRPGINRNLAPKTSNTLAKHDEGARRFRARLVVIRQIVDLAVIPGDANGRDATASESHRDNAWLGEQH